MFAANTPKSTIMQCFGERLKAARKIKGWSLQDLANHTDNSITKQALSKYEADLMQPSRKILLLLSAALGVKPGYFESQPAIKLPEFEFPRKGTISTKQIESIKEKVKSVLENQLQAEALLQITARFSNPIKDISVSNEEDAVLAATRLAGRWELGKGTLHNVTAMLEEKQVRVVTIDTPVFFEALSTYAGRMPLIVLHNGRQADLRRFSALYELGRLLLSFTPSADKDKACQAFASAMLLPGNTLETVLGDKRTSIAPGELASIKEQYGIPMQAALKYAIFRGIIGKKEVAAFFKGSTDQQDEAGAVNYSGCERSYRHDRMLLRLMAEEIITMQHAAGLSDVPAGMLKKRMQILEGIGKGGLE